MRLSTVVVSVGLGNVGLGLAMNATPAKAGVCEDLWVQRNSIYKAYGYCFKTAKAINYFDNAGCIYKDAAKIPLSRADQQTILNIKKREREPWAVSRRYDDPRAKHAQSVALVPLGGAFAAAHVGDAPSAASRNDTYRSGGHRARDHYLAEQAPAAVE